MSSIFAKEPQGSDVLWKGDVFNLFDDREVMPFKFLGLCFVALFTTPLQEAGGDEEFLLTQSTNWAGGFVPHASSRIVKFCRRDNSGNRALFHPDGWSLQAPGQIFAFSEHLAEVVVKHYYTVSPIVEQYFFWPANERAGLLYRRTFRSVNDLLDGLFVPILEDLGEFRGYQKAS
ncbi:hypothetical protein [Acidovorax sp.]|uniref:hypothetical protein n=1 Tax=Acidovorax sp. TaxID=1872122 RepID=UPI00391F444B